MQQRGFSLIEALVALGLTVILILSAYDMFSDIGQTNLLATSKLGALSTVRTTEDQVRFYLEHAGLGVPSGTEKITQAERNTLSVNLNSGFFSYSKQDYFLPANTATNLQVDEVEDTGTGASLMVLSMNQREVSSTPVLQAYDKALNQLTLLNPTALWISKNSYVGVLPGIHTLAVANNQLTLTMEGQTTVLVDGIEALDVAFLYDPPWIDANENGVVDSEEDPDPVWCYDAAEDYPEDYDPDGMQRILDTDLSGDITFDDDQDSDSVIEGRTLPGATDTDGNGKVDGISFDKASLARVWMLINGKKVFGASGNETYLVGRRILSFEDGRQRVVSYIDISLKNSTND